MKKSMISIITPCYNAEKYIELTVKSILSQSYKHFELIIQDSKSTDRTLEILEQFRDDRIKVISENDQDIHHGLWKGLQRSKGDYIMFMPASDEYLHSDWFKHCVDILDNNNLIGLVHGNDIKKYKNGKYGSLRFPEFVNKKMPSGTKFLPYWIATKYHISELNYCVRKEIYLDCYGPYEPLPLDPVFIKNDMISIDTLQSWNPLIMFTYNFVRKGYLPEHVPITATATLIHDDGTRYVWGAEINNVVNSTYLSLIEKLENNLFSKKIEYCFKDGFGNIIKRKNLNYLKFKKEVFKHKIFRKDFDFFYKSSINIHNIVTYLKPFLYPKRFIMKLSFFKYIRFIKHYFQFKKLNDGRFSISRNHTQIEINDWSNNHIFDSHYVYHTAWAARILYFEKPKKHIDISSDVRFSSLISTFVKTEYFDIRELKIDLSNLNTGLADLVNLPFQSESISSLSCMHVVEHCGLGRYGDVVDPVADLKAINELIRVLKPDGRLYFVVPLASNPRINFNAHRVYSHSQIIEYFSKLQLIEFTLIPDTYKHDGMITNPSKSLIDKQNYACGCFLFKK